MRFLNKLVLVTGAVQGIGEFTTRRFAKDGAKVGLLDIKTSLVKYFTMRTDITVAQVGP